MKIIASGTVTFQMAQATRTVFASKLKPPYKVTLGPSWNTTAWVENKLNGSFIIKVDTEPDATETIDWVAFS